MKIRTALTQDAGTIAAIDASQIFGAHWSAAQIQSELAQPAGHVLVCDEQGVIAGFIAFRCAAGVGEILNLAVRPDKLRRGAGTLLVRGALEFMRRQGPVQLSLEVNERNLPARALYEKTGFAVLARRKKFYNNADDALIMGINL